MRLLRRFALALVPLLLVAAVVVLALSRSGAVSSSARRAARQMLSDALGRNVAVRRASVSTAGRVTLHGVRVPDDNGQPLLTARAIIIARPLWPPTSLSWRSVRSITIDSPSLALQRDARGRWNIEQLLKALKPSAAPGFAGRVAVRGGTITLRDAAPARPLRAPQSFKLTHLDALLDFGRPPAVQFSARARNANPRTTLHLAGTSKHQAATATITAADVPLSRLLPYLVSHESVRVISGRADLTGYVSFQHGKKPPLYVVSARTSGCDVRLAGVPEILRGVTGSLLIQSRGARGAVRLDGVRARAGGAALVANGRITGWERTRLDLDLDVRASSVARALQAAGVREIPREIGLKSPGRFQVNLRGPTDNLLVRASGSTTRVNLGALTLRQPSADITYRAGSLHMRDLKGGLAGGRLRGDAWFTIGSRGQFVFSGNMSSADAGELAEAAGAGIPTQGRASGPVWVRWDKGGLRVVADTALAGGKAWSVPVARVYIDASAAGAKNKPTTVNRLTASSCGGQWTAGGTIGGKGALDMRIAAVGVDVARLAGPLKVEAVSGRADAWGRIRGSAQKPVFEGRVQIAEPAWKDERLDALFADVTVAADRVSISNGAGYRGDAEFALAGAISQADWSKRKGRAALSLTARSLPLADAAALAGVQTDADGLLYGEVAIEGPLDDLQARGTLTLTDAELAGQSIATGRAEFAARAGEFELISFEGAAGSSVVRARGKVGAEGAMDIFFGAPDLNLTDIDIPRLADAGVYLSGKARIEGRVSGTTKEPVVQATLASDAISLAGNVFTEIAGSLQSDGKTLTVQARGKQAAGRYQFSGTFEEAAAEAVPDEPRPLPMSLGVVIEEGDLSAVRSVLEALAPVAEPGSHLSKALERLIRAPRPLAGMITAYATASGPSDRLAGEVHFTASSPTLQAQILPDLGGDLSFNGSRLKIQNAQATREQAHATASGEVDFDGQMAVHVDAYNLSAELLEPWLEPGVALAGSGDVSFDITGPTESPHAIGSLEVSDFALGQAKFDRLRVTGLTVREQEIDLGETVATKGPYQIAASGHLPFSWSPFSIPKDQPLLVRVEAKGQDLGLLKALLPSLQQAAGPLDAEVTIAGTRLNPVLQDGSLSLSGGTVKAAEAGEFAGLVARLHVKDNVIAVESAQAEFAQGSVALAAGSTVRLKDPGRGRLDEHGFDVRATARGLRERLGGAAHGIVDADLHLTNGAHGRALLQGKATGRGGWEADLAHLGSVSALKPAAFDPALDVAVAMEPTVWFRSAAAELGMSGQGHVGGRLSAPQIAASLEGRRGWLLFPAGRFRVTYASADVTARAEPGEAMTTRTDLHIESEGVIAGYQVFLTITGPADNPAVSARAIPALSQQEVNALLTTGQPVVSGPMGATQGATLTQVARGALGTGLGAVALRPLERAFAQSLGIEELGFDFRYGEPIRVRAGTYVLPKPLGSKLYLSYTRLLAGAASTSSLRATYEVLRSLSVGLSVDEQDIMRFELQRTKRF